MSALFVGVSQLQSSIPDGLLPFARDIPEVSLNPAALLISIVTGVAILIILVSWAKVHPFLAIMLAALITGIGSGFGLMNTVHAFLDGFGDTTKSVGILVGIGAMLGAVLMVTGATGVLVDVLISKSSRKMLPWTMALIGSLIGLPLFFDVGLIIMAPVIIMVTRKSKMPLMMIAMPALAGLCAMQALVPPHPGPTAALQTFENGSMGITMGMGIVLAIPLVIICGPLFAKYSTRIVPRGAPDTFAMGDKADGDEGRRKPSFGLSLLCVTMPAILLLITSIIMMVRPDLHDSKEMGAQILQFIGNPEIALLISLVFASLTLFVTTRYPWEKLNDEAGKSLRPIAGIVFILGAGGGFKNLLIDTGIGDMITKFVENTNISIILIAWVIAVFVRVATGSSTVSAITTAGILEPTATALAYDPIQTGLLVLAIGAGSFIFSFVNDAGLWLVKEYFGFTLPEMFKTWTVMTCLISIVGLVLVWGLGLFLL
ncbi:GntP family permease [Actinotignum sp. GS-2025c]|uniref:GntP family permease n=1 Tax=Actinotignum sp. GS-2025c TaxID=3427276 RepID=UPI003F468F17